MVGYIVSDLDTHCDRVSRYSDYWLYLLPHCTQMNNYTPLLVFFQYPDKEVVLDKLNELRDLLTKNRLISWFYWDDSIDSMDYEETSIEDFLDRVEDLIRANEDWDEERQIICNMLRDIIAGDLVHFCKLIWL